VVSSPAGEVAPGQLAHQRRAAFLKLGVNSSGFFVFGEQSEKRHASSKATDHSCTCEHLRAVSIGKHKVVSCRDLPCSGAAHLLCLQSNVMLPRTSVRHPSETMIKDGEHNPSLLFPRTKPTATDPLFCSLKKERHDHIVLHKKSGVQTSNFVASSTAKMDDFASLLPAHKRDQMDAFVSGHHRSRKVSNGCDMFLAAVWITAVKRCIFRKSPCVVKIMDIALLQDQKLWHSLSDDDGEDI
jgi:hypothetical protein